MIKTIRALVRPTVTWAMVALFGYVVVIQQVSIEATMAIIGTVIGFWFNERTKKKEEK